MKKWTGLPRPFSHLNLGNKFFLPSCDIVFNSKSWNYLHYLCALTNVSIWNVINGNGTQEPLRTQRDTLWIFIWRKKLWSQVNSILYVYTAQCGNFIIFLSLRFCVKSILGFLEVKIFHFNTFIGSEFWFIWYFAIFEG